MGRRFGVGIGAVEVVRRGLLASRGCVSEGSWTRCLCDCGM